MPTNIEDTPIYGKLSIISMKGTEELTAKIDRYLKTFREFEDEESYITKVTCPRFGTGEAKCVIGQTVRGHDVFIICDVFNHGVTYKMYGYENHMSPDDHFQDLKRIISAMGGKARRVTVVMPMLYEGRQHRRSGRESLDAAMMLHELVHMGVTNIITFDAHDPRIQNAIPHSGFDNVQPTYQMIKALVRAVPDIELNKEKTIVISPDEGGMSRSMYYSAVLKLDLGMFYKRRNYSVVIVDDMIASGESMIDVASKIKAMGAKRIFVFTSFGLFTGGLEVFDRAYEEGIINKVFTTNLVYRNPGLKSREWYCEVELAKYISLLINTINHDNTISDLLNPVQKIQNLIDKVNK